jgi:RES domain-containing protein
VHRDDRIDVVVVPSGVVAVDEFLELRPVHGASLRQYGASVDM